MSCSLQPHHLALTLLHFNAFPSTFRKANLLPPLASCWTELWIFYFYSLAFSSPTILVFLSFSSMHSKYFLLFQTWTSLLLLLEDLYTTLIPNRFLFIYAGLDLGLVHAAFERELFFDYFFCPVSP